MKIALIGDLHGNLPATEAMARALEKAGVEEIFFLGDAVGKGPSSRETCDWARTHCSRFVGGNWDYGVGGKEYAEDQYFWDQLGEERLHWLNNLPREDEFTISGVRFRMFHGRPVTPLLFVQEDKEALEATFRTERGVFGGVVFADSHRPFLRTLNTGYILNCGSVGNSLGVNRAHAIIMEGELNSPDPAPLSMTILSVPYDIDAAVALADERLPHREAYIHEITTGEYAR
ncbi:MAG: metallophosphoesterase family protein [Clostridia bacterium]|nr:metallophosphoesterase family protein [Clostridia bacterium]